MEDRERIILDFSDDEIAQWYVMYGECPHQWHKRRLARIRETHPLFRPGGRCGPIRSPFTGREAEVAASARNELVTREYRYALENLLDRPLPRRGEKAKVA